LNNTLLTEILPFLQEKGIGIISASPLSMGLLTQRGAPDWHPATDEIKAGCARAAAFCKERGVDIAKLAIQFAVQHPGIATTLVGTASEENIRKNVDWINDPLDEQLLLEVQQILSPIHNRTWESGQNAD
jgi:aryl-alcohol dehydrogenase-like predicted oxidoreductase